MCNGHVYIISGEQKEVIQNIHTHIQGTRKENLHTHTHTLKALETQGKKGEKTNQTPKWIVSQSKS